MPPALVDPEQETDEQRRQRLSFMGGMPPAPIAPPQPVLPSPSPAMPAAPVANAPERSGPFSGGPAGAPGVQSMPPAPVGPQTQAYQQLAAQGEPKLSGWRKALDTIARIFPLGQAIEQEIPGSPGNFNARLAQAAMRAAKEQGIEQNQGAESRAQAQERRNEAAFPSENALRIAQAKKAEAAAAEQPEHSIDKKIDEYVNADGNRVITFQRPNGETYDKVGGSTFQQQPQDANKLAAEIEAQVGQKPKTPQFAGKTYPSIEAAQEAWGKAAEAIKNREAAASGAARGEGYNSSRPVQVLVPQPDGTMQPVYMSAGAAIAGGYAPAAPGAKAVSQTAQFDDIVNASQQVRNALEEAGETAFTPAQTAKLSLAMKETDPSTMRDEIANLAASGLTPAQQDLVTWLYQLQERALSLRSIAGMGQGSDTTRLAIIKALPGITSGNKQMALKQLDAFDNMVGNLRRGILTVKGRESTAPRPPEGKSIVYDPEGVPHFVNTSALSRFLNDPKYKGWSDHAPARQ